MGPAQSFLQGDVLRALRQAEGPVPAEQLLCRVLGLVIETADNLAQHGYLVRESIAGRTCYRTVLPMHVEQGRAGGRPPKTLRPEGATRQIVVKLRARGLSYRAIADVCGISKPAVIQHCKRQSVTEEQAA